MYSVVAKLRNAILTALCVPDQIALLFKGVAFQKEGWECLPL